MTKSHHKVKQPVKIGVLDFETDPFDNKIRSQILPFLCVLYFSEDDYKVFRSENYGELMHELLAYLDSITTPLLIYAHNGGRFDYKLMVRYIRGPVMCQPGRIMKFTSGIHEFRDSVNLLKGPLIHYHKEVFDYNKMRKDVRERWMAEIERYCVSDCRYLHQAVLAAREKWGNVLTSGQAGKKEMLKYYPDCCGMTEKMDERYRTFFRGGRVDCIEGSAIFKGKYQCWDFNSSYPAVMANFNHPNGKNYFDYCVRSEGGITSETAFVELDCISNGAFLFRAENDPARGPLLSTPRDEVVRRYYVTIQELRVALKFGLLKNIKYHKFHDCKVWINFKQYVEANYKARIITKKLLETLPKNTSEYHKAKLEDILVKTILNTGYGKFAQDPRRFREYLFTDADAPHPGGNWEYDTLFFERNEIYLPEGLMVWRRPSPGQKRFNNVATAASITGAARANLLEALQFAKDPIYADTDSIICKGFHEKIYRNGQWQTFPFPLDEAQLGALKLEWEASEVGIGGKKLYYALTGEKPIIKAKGFNGSDITVDMLRGLINMGDTFTNVSKAPVFKLDGSQNYIERTVRRTASVGSSINGSF